MILVRNGKFARLSQSLVEKGGAFAVADEASLTTAAARLLRSPSIRAEMIAAARRVLDPHRGATERTADLLKALPIARLKSLARFTAAPILGAPPDPIVQWPRTLPFHGGNTGSNPVRVASSSRRKAWTAPAIRSRPPLGSQIVSAQERAKLPGDRWSQLGFGIAFKPIQSPNLGLILGFPLI